MAAIYNFLDIKKSTTFNARKFTFPFSITGACIVMQFKHRSNGENAFAWKTSDNTIDIISDTEMIMTSRNMDYPVSEYIYDIIVTLLDGTVQIYFEGSLEITDKISEKCPV